MSAPAKETHCTLYPYIGENSFDAVETRFHKEKMLEFLEAYSTENIGSVSVQFWGGNVNVPYGSENPEILSNLANDMIQAINAKGGQFSSEINEFQSGSGSSSINQVTIFGNSVGFLEINLFAKKA